MGDTSSATWQIRTLFREAPLKKWGRFRAVRLFAGAPHAKIGLPEARLFADDTHNIIPHPVNSYGLYAPRVCTKSKYPTGRPVPPKRPYAI